MLAQKIRSVVSRRSKDRPPAAELCPVVDPARISPTVADWPRGTRELLPWADPYIAELQRQHEERLRRDRAASSRW